jgi:hypothetical protein
VRESRTPGSVRGVLSNEHPYRDRVPLINPPPMRRKATFTLLRPSFQAENGDCWPKYETLPEERSDSRLCFRVIPTKHPAHDQHFGTWAHRPLLIAIYAASSAPSSQFSCFSGKSE